MKAVDQVILPVVRTQQPYNTFTVFLLYTHWDSKKNQKHLLVFIKIILCGKWCFCHDFEMLNDAFKMSKPPKQILKVNSSTRKIPQN